jgi:hypothetical protein
VIKLKQLPERIKKGGSILIKDGCPSEYGLKDYCNNGNTYCVTCWHESLKELEKEKLSL